MLTIYNKFDNTAFQAYIKVKDAPEKISRLKDTLPSLSDDFCFINNKKLKNKETISILSKKDYDKFLDLLQTINIKKLRENLTFYLGKKPDKMTVNEVVEKFQK